MTLTELEKLEALHAAATPGEWKGDRLDGTVKYRLHSEACDCDPDETWDCPHLVLEVDHKNGTSGFHGKYSFENERLIIALHNAFPAMAKALREALIAADAANRERADWMHSLDRAKEDIAKLMKERDEARAEVAQLREIVKTAGDRLRACAEQLTEHSYQEMASVLYDLPAPAEVAP